MRKNLWVIILIFLLTNSAQANILYDEKYLNIKFNKNKTNCGNHITVGAVDKILLRKRFSEYEGKNTRDFTVRSIILKENKFIKKDKKISLFYDYNFKDSIFEKEFELIFKNEKKYIFAAEFNSWPSEIFYKNVIFFIIDRYDLEISAGAIYIKNETDYKLFKSYDMSKIEDINGYVIEQDLMNIFDTGFSKEDSYVRYTPLASCKIEEVESPKQKI